MRWINNGFEHVHTGSVESVEWLNSIRSIRNVQVLFAGLSLDFKAFLCRNFAKFENRSDGWVWEKALSSLRISIVHSCRREMHV